MNYNLLMLYIYACYTKNVPDGDITRFMHIEVFNICLYGSSESLLELDRMHCSIVQRLLLASDNIVHAVELTS